MMLRRLAGKTSDAELRSFLGSFDFRGERIDTPSESFSGGERARLTLALIVWQRPNVLVLDEPTNHLDLQMRQALTLALQGFAGAVVLVSHDRELIANVCDELYLVHDGIVEEFDGDVSDYGKWLAEKRKQNQANENSKKAANKDTKGSKSATANKAAAAPKPVQVDNTPTLSKEELRKQAAELRKQTAPLRKHIEKAEAALEKIAVSLSDLEERLADTSLYDDSRKADLLALLDEQTALQQQQAQQEEEMLAAMTELEEMEA
jgi:ATP-binding cassette subfamily F protein 3